ncbi:SufE family protein [Raineya sp.]|jgi:cysteine desulfuration protein SufE
MNIQEIQDEIISEFELFDNWDDKYAYIIELGKKLPPLSETYKTEENLVKGCQSKVWLHGYKKDDKVFFEADSDALIVKGLVSLLLRVYSGQPAEAIAQTEPYFIQKIGLQQHLSMTRANGLASMIKQIRTYGVALQSS